MNIPVQQIVIPAPAVGASILAASKKRKRRSKRVRKGHRAGRMHKKANAIPVQIVKAAMPAGTASAETAEALPKTTSTTTGTPAAQASAAGKWGFFLILGALVFILWKMNR